MLFNSMNIKGLSKIIASQFEEIEEEKDIKIPGWTIVVVFLLIAAPALIWDIWVRMNQSGGEINFAFISLFIIQVFMYYYLPATAIYGIARVLSTGNIQDTMRHPFLGFGRLSPQSGFIVWSL